MVTPEAKTELPFAHVVIVGVGLLGASLGLALKARKLAARVTGIGRAGSPSLGIAQKIGAIDLASTELRSAVADAELVVLCTPVRQFSEALRTIRVQARGGTIVTDVGSTKGEVMKWAEQHFSGSAVKFVGSHPMAGSEKRGPEAGRADLYQGAMCLMCAGTNDGDGRALARVEGMWRAVGMSTLRLLPAEHDRWVATISHLPHAAAFSLMNAAAKHPEMLAAVAGGFLDTTRVASSDVDMWTDIFLTNRAAVVGAIDEFAADLSSLRAAIERGDEAGIRKALGDAKRSRDELMARRKNGAGGE